MISTICKTLISFLIIGSFFTIKAQDIAQKRNVVMKLSTLPIYFPLPQKKFKRISSHYGMRYHPILKKRIFHSGLDLTAAKGTAIYASANGKVVISTYSKTHGNYVTIEHGKKYKTLYGHMSKRMVKIDETVKQGDLIGFVGSTGRSTGPHLHYEILEYNKRIDPYNFWMNLAKSKKIDLYNIK